MSQTIKITLGLCLAAFVGACSQPEPEPVFIEPAPIVAEPSYTKY
ncbi:hypothetical protein [Palleronia pontilimi]|nr:hypothetical protein [Palleronia pontilimi]